MVLRYRSDSPPFYPSVYPPMGFRTGEEGAQINLLLRCFNKQFLGYLWKELVAPEVDNFSDSLVYRKGSQLGTTR